MNYIFLTKFGRGLRLVMIEAPKVRMRKTIKVKMLKSKIYDESDGAGDDGEDSNADGDKHEKC